MTGARCPRRKMMGRGAAGGCGTEEKPCPVSRPSSSRPSPPPAAVDLYAQARKALSDRSPFDDEAAGSKPPNVPAGLAGFLYKHSDGRRKHKKSHGETTPKKSFGHGHGQAPARPTLWDETEEYFRPLTLADIDALVPALPFGPAPPDSCLSIPILGKKAGALDCHVVEMCSRMVPIAVEEHAKAELESVEEEQAEQAQKMESVEEEQAQKMESVEEEQAHKVESVDKDQAEQAQKVESVQEESAIAVDEAATCSHAPMEIEEDDSASMSWLLGSKYRFLLTSERPNKKHKLLGGDAGLDQLLQLPHLSTGASELHCHVCCLGSTGMKSDRFLHCISCKVSVHQKCYGVHDIPAGTWLCSWCRHLEVSGKQSKKDLRPCVLCPKEGGALKPVGRNIGGRSSSSEALNFVHLFCSLWTPEVYVEDTGIMEPVLNVGGVHETRRKLVCYLCKVKHGVCIRCSHGTCRTSFHPLCARESNHQMEIWGKFGCDNVELRAFCAKHSTSHDNRVKYFENSRANAADITLVAKPPPPLLPINKLPKLRLTRGNRDKIMPQDETTRSEKLVKIESTPEADTLAVRLGLEGGEAQLIKDMDTDGVTGSGNTITNSPDLALLLRKLIDRGKINVDVVASEIGISSNSLEAALLGETTSFSPGLRLKIIRWLQDSTHIFNTKSASSTPSSNGVGRLDGTNTAKLAGSFVPVDVKVTGLDTPDAVVVKSLPPRRRTKSNIMILKDKRRLCPSAVTYIKQNGNGKLDDENDEIPVVLTEDMNGEVNNEKSSLHDQDYCFKGLELTETNLEDIANPIDSSPPMNLSPGLKGDLTKIKSIDLPKSQLQLPSMTERVSCFESIINQANEANIAAPNSLEKGALVNPGCDVDMEVSGGQPALMADESCSSYVHPFIQRRLVQVQGYAVSKRDCREAYSNGGNEKAMHSVEVDTLASVCSDQQPLHSSCTDINHVLDATKLDQLAKAKDMGVLELSPEDEVEGEMLYLQTRLLDRAVAIKHSCEDLILRVVRNLHQELDALNKQRWDLILISQFIREVREAKKRGRKERRHKEAQAVLAAAAAAVAASSRNSSLRKDANDEVFSTQESPLKVSVISGRVKVSSPLSPQAKESSRLTLAKVSSDKHSGLFKLPDFSQENALSCDICRRAETVLNRIFVCSSCKVAVHLDCYCRLKNPIGSWKCELCEEMTSQSRNPINETADGRGRYYADVHCNLCGAAAGAFRKSTNGQWVHAFCAEWLLESRYIRGQQNPVEGMDAILQEKNLLSCCLCQRNVGVCLKCSYGHCPITFHPSCARSAGLYMNIKANGGRLQHKAYCEKHSLEQREADSQQHGAEELKTIKQIRVELEKVRLLCERIIKREKLKRDLVLCSHDVLASRRDYVAFSMLVRSSFFPPGVSSESATTSINNRSYSGTIQRSDDITVDSSASGKRTVRFPVHTDADRKTDDSSTSQLSFKRKLSNRASFSGKQLPQRPASVALWNSALDGEKRSKTRKHAETFQKELVMTSDQASMQNQRLPKGFAYVPVGSLSKEKPAIDNMESHEPREPGG